MKHERMTASAFLMAVILAVLISFCAVMCLRDAFNMDGEPWILLAACGLAAVPSALSARLKRSWTVNLAAAAVYGAALVWKREQLRQSVRTVIYAITSEYAKAFDTMRVVGAQDGEALWALLALAVPMAWMIAGLHGREGGSLLTLLLVMPVLVLVLLVVDLAPVLWLILLTGGLLVVLVSHSVRERSAAEGSRLAWWLVLPTVILVSGITVLWPPADYVRADWSEALQKLVEAKTSVQAQMHTWQQEIADPRPQWDRELKTVDLRRIGPKKLTGAPVLQYRADGAVSYLRGVSLAVYEDNAWKALPTEQYKAYALPDEPLLGSIVGTNLLEVETLTAEPQLYTAYCLSQVPETGGAVDDAYLQNTDRLKSYRVFFAPDLRTPVGTSPESDRLAAEVYTQVPEELRGPLEAIAAENGLTGASAGTVADFVRTSGVYDLNTPSMPAGKDFVLYFLQESHQGYCVHFASAAVMLLRTVGIPARYVTGYAVEGPQTQWNQVLEDDAHAWVEYYTAGIGWRPLDPTPADAGTGEPAQNAQPQDDPTGGAPQRPEGSEPESVPETSPSGAPEEVRGTDFAGIRNTARPLPRALLWLLVLPGLALALWLRRWFGLRRRRERCEKGHPNRRTLAYWRWLVQLSRAEEKTVEEPLLCLAEKARFSQHTMDEAEIAQLRQAVEACIRQLQGCPLGKRLWYQYGLVLF